MKRTFKFRTAAVIIAFLMALSFVTTAVFAEESVVATVEFDYTGAAQGVSYKPIYDSNYYMVYWNDGTPKYPGVTVTVNVGGETITLVEDVDYQLSFAACYDMDGDFSQMYSVTKEDCVKEGFFKCLVSGRSGSPYEDAVEAANKSSSWYVILNRPPYNVRFFKNSADDQDTYTETGAVAYGAKVPADSVPNYDNPGYKFVGWYLKDGTKFEPDDPLMFDYTQTSIQNVDVYAIWEKEDDPTPGGDDPVPGGDGTDDTDGGKPSPDTGVENMMPLFMWLFAVSGLIIFSIKKKRA